MSVSEVIHGSPWGFGRSAIRAVVLCLAIAGPSVASDSEARSLPERLQLAHEVLLGSSLHESDDGLRLTVRVEHAVRGRFCRGDELMLPHPRLATAEGFIRFSPGSRFVYLLFRGDDAVWRPIELGESATFRVEGQRVILATPEAPDVTLSKQGTTVTMALETFLDVAEVCRPGGVGESDACRRRFAAALAEVEADRDGSPAGSPPERPPQVRPPLRQASDEKPTIPGPRHLVSRRDRMSESP